LRRVEGDRSRDSLQLALFHFSLSVVSAGLVRAWPWVCYGNCSRPCRATRERGQHQCAKSIRLTVQGRLATNPAALESSLANLGGENRPPKDVLPLAKLTKKIAAASLMARAPLERANLREQLLWLMNITEVSHDADVAIKPFRQTSSCQSVRKIHRPAIIESAAFPCDINIQTYFILNLEGEFNIDAESNLDIESRTDDCTKTEQQKSIEASRRLWLELGLDSNERISA
ncbi:hypothetical protein C8R47DRAFT_1276773, partial [Mycena vitilis]